MKELLIAAGLLAAATTAAMAQNGPPGPPSGGYGYGYYGYGGGGGGPYDYAPGYAAPYADDMYGNGTPDYRPRGGPGPRVGHGTGAGIGSQR